jgi:hypothetical protein
LRKRAGKRGEQPAAQPQTKHKQTNKTRTHLLHVDAAREQVGRDQDAAAAAAELAHDDVARVLVHVAVRRADGVVALAHLVRLRCFVGFCFVLLCVVGVCC